MGKRFIVDMLKLRVRSVDLQQPMHLLVARLNVKSDQRKTEENKGLTL